MTWRPTLADRLTRAVVRTAGALPAALQQRLAGGPVVVDGQRLDPEVALALRLLALAPGPTFEELPLAQSRAQLIGEAWAFGYDTPVETVQDSTVPGPGGPIPVRLYRPAGLAPRGPALVYLHGGGWVLGDFSSADSVCRFLAVHAGVTVISVDYRLAPEHPFPAAVDDVVAAFDHVVAHADAWDVDPARVAVGGESAGGNLAAVVAQQRTGDGGPALQLLLMPVTDLSTEHRSYELFGTGYFLTAAQMHWYRDHYVTDPEQVRDPRVSPLLADDVAGVAPGYVAVAGFDPLRDEGEAYAAKLAAAGVPVALRRFAGTSHAAVNAVGVGHGARDMLLEIAASLRMGLGGADSPA